MGTGLEADQHAVMDGSALGETIGILPRSVHHLFSGMERFREEEMQAGRTPPEFRVHAQFLELYNEEIFDLLEPASRVRSLFFFVVSRYFTLYHLSSLSPLPVAFF